MKRLSLFNHEKRIAMLETAMEMVLDEKESRALGLIRTVGSALGLCGFIGLLIEAVFVIHP